MADSPRKATKKRWFRLAIIPAAVTFAILVSAFFLIQTQAAKSALFRHLQKYLLERSGMELQASAIRADWIRGEASLENVTLRHISAPGMPPLFKAARIDIRADISRLIRGFREIEELRVTAPEINYFADHYGKSNLPESKSGSGSDFNLFISHGEAKDGVLRIRDIRRGIDLQLLKWQISADGDSTTNTHRLAFAAGQESSFEYEPYRFPLHGLAIRADLKKTGLQVNSFQLETDGFRLSATGLLSGLSKPVLDLQLKPALDLGKIARILNLSPKIEGNVSGNVSIRGNLEDLRITAQLKGASISAAGYARTAFSSTASAEWFAGSKRLRIRNLDLASADGSIKGNAEFFFTPEAGFNSIEADFQNFDLSPLWKMLTPPFDLASRGAGQAALRWKGPFSASKISGNVRLNLSAARSAPDLNVLPISGKIDAKIQSGRIEANLSSIGVLESQVSGRVSLRSFREIEGSIRGYAPHTNAMMTRLSQFLGGSGSFLRDLRMAGPVEFLAHASGRLKQPKFIISADAPDLQIGGLAGTKATAGATIEGPYISFDSALILPGNSLSSVKGSMDLAGSRPLLDLEARTERIQAASILSILGSEVPVEGFFDAELHLNGNLDGLAGTAQVAGTELFLYREPLGRLDAGLKISGTKIESTQIRLHKNPENPEAGILDADFVYDLDSGQFEFQADGRGMSITQLKLPGGYPVQGVFAAAASGTGTLDQPSVDIRLNTGDAHLRQIPLGPLSIEGSLREGQLTIGASAPRFNIDSTAQIGVHNPYPYSGEIRFGNSDLSLLGLKGASGQLLSGTVEALVTGSGKLSEPSAARISARIQSLKLEAGALNVHTKGLTTAEYRDGSLEISPAATLASGNSSLQIAGRAPLRQTAPDGSLTLKGELDLAQAAGFAPTSKGFNVAGIMNLELSLAGNPRNLKGEGRIALAGGTINLPGISTPLTDIRLRADLKGGALVLQQAEAAWGDGKIALTGEFPLGLLPKNIPVQFMRKEGPASFNFDMTHIRPESTGLLPPGVTGLISLHAAGQTASPDLRALDARIDFGELSLKVKGVPLNQAAPSTIFVRDGTASISSFSLNGPDTRIDVDGSAGILPDGPLNIKLSGDVDAGLLSLVKDLKATGKLRFQVVTAGTLKSPTFSGQVGMDGGRLSLREPRIVADSLTARLGFTPDKISIQQFSGTLNGGTVDAKGTIGYRHGILNDFDVKINFQDFFLDFPKGLKSASNGNLTITSSEEAILASGEVHVIESSYRESFAVGGQLMSYLKSQQIIEQRSQSGSILDRLRLSIALQADTPLLIHNNIARVEADANLKLVGTLREPSLVGRADLYEGGEIVLNQRIYYIDRGIITLNNQMRFEPELDVKALTTVGDYSITLQLTGVPERLMTTLTSEPSLSEPDIISLLLTGKTSSDMEGQGKEIHVAQTQALSLLAGRAGEELTRGARQALHLSTLRIDPGLIASEPDAGTWLTLGEDITRDLSFGYSMNLANAGEQAWAAQYKITRRFTAQTTRQSDNAYRFEIRQDLHFGGAPGFEASAKTVRKFTVGSIEFNGASPYTDKVLLNQMKIKSGDKYDFAKIQKGLDRLQEFMAEEKRLEADIRLHRETRQQTIDLRLNIDPGPIVDFTFKGASVSKDTQQKVEQAWRDGVFSKERLDEAVLAIRRPLLREGYLQSEVTYRLEEEDQQIRVHFNITPGLRFTGIELSFPGASEISGSELDRVLDLANLKLEVHASPQRVVDYLTAYYRERGYLQARVETPQTMLDSQTGTGKIEVPIQEGPLFLIGNLDFKGNRALDYDQLWSAIPTSSGSMYDPNTLQDAIREIEDLYHKKGYNDAKSTFRVVQDSKAARAHLTFEINEHRQSIIRDIVIEGNRDTSDGFILKQLGFEPGEALDYLKINETRKRLYNTGVYALVDFQTEELPESAPDSTVKDVRIRIRIEEIKPYRLQYGLFYDTDRGMGGLLEVQDRNLLGQASNVGMRIRYDSDLKEGRLYFHQPFVTKIHVRTDATAFALKEVRPAFNARRIGFSLSREERLPKEYLFTYGYRYDHVRWNGYPPDPQYFQASDPVARVIGTLTRDTRDSILDATRGEFSSHSLEYGPEWLGSEVGFIRYYGQYFRYVPLDKFLKIQSKDKQGQPAPTKLVYAGALRLGLTTAFEHQTVISPERFFAGGGTTMRGFEQDLLGPQETVVIDGENVQRPTGGEALFLFNNELRFPIFGILHGVGFADIGNVYPRVSDFDFSMRKTAGFGLRLKIKFIPLRFDYGWKLDRRPGESKGAFFFSIGQAF